ncbi:sugar ABC transporter permease [Bailinhaonella thermotolerans]|uniref:Sugar ABC transporter permease n=1 Tax=Bailinhaonella thermotolerans TaxID=1070861 RepID=A0A3A4A604_9ACTN|nr:sugar ABC transporter permease [Bailinhaonella thermotolerans]
MDRRRGAAILFVAPFLLCFVAVTIVPLAYAAALSLFTEKASGLGFGPAETVFAGVDNYVRALSDPAFRGGFLIIAAYCLVYLPLMVGGALVLALLLDSAAAKMKRLLQLALFLPHAVPGLIAAIIWVYLYTPGLSPIVALLEWDFLASDHVLLSVVNIATWEWIGYNVIIFYAALQAVPREILEAATVDGARGLRLAFAIKVPMIRAAVVMAGLFTVIGAIQLFTEPKIINRAASTVSSSWTPNMYALTAAFERHDYGLAAAASMLIALLGAVLSFAVTRATARRSSR